MQTGWILIEHIMPSWAGSKITAVFSRELVQDPDELQEIRASVGTRVDAVYIQKLATGTIRWPVRIIGKAEQLALC